MQLYPYGQQKVPIRSSLKVHNWWFKKLTLSFKVAPTLERTQTVPGMLYVPRRRKEEGIE